MPSASAPDRCPEFFLPGVNGLELIEEVGKRWPETKFVLASGFLTDAVYARIEKYMVSIPGKPYDRYDASKIVMEKLAKKRTTRRAPRKSSSDSNH